MAQCRVGVEVSREKRPNKQKFKKGEGKLVFVLLCFNYSTMLVKLTNVWYRCMYILGKVKTHTRASADTHNILDACTSPELYTCKYGDISSKTVVILPYFVHMHVSFFRLKRLMLQKGKSKCFSWHSRDNISGAWSQIRPGKHCST